METSVREVAPVVTRALPRPRRGGRLAIWCVFGVLALVWLHPLLPVLRTGWLHPGPDPTGLGRADSMLTGWMLGWAAHALRTAPHRLFHANIFHPLPWTFAFSENLLAGALLVLPVDLVAGDPVLDNNALVIATFVLSGAGTALLLRELGAGLPAAVLAGVLFAFGPARFGAIGHLHALSAQWMPFALLALLRCLRTGRGAVAVAVTLLLVALSSVYYAYFFGLAAALFLAFHWLLGCPAAPGGRRRAVAGAVAAGMGAAIVLVPYAIARDVYGLARDTQQAAFFGAVGQSFLGAATNPLGYLARRYLAGENPMTILGPAMLILFAIGAAVGAPAPRGRRLTACFAAVAVAMACVALGPALRWSPHLEGGPPGPWALLAALVPGWAALRVPVRAAIVAVLAVAVVAGCGADALWRRARTRGARAALAALFVAIGVAESWRPPFVVERLPWAGGTRSEVHRWLAEQPDRDAVVALPIGNPLRDASHMTRAAAHWRPLVNGYSGFTPTAAYFRTLLAAFPDARSIGVLHEIGVRWVVVHPAETLPPQNTLCAGDPARLGAWVTVAHRGADGCVLEIRGAPPAPAPPPDRPLPLAGVRVTTSGGDAAAAAIDGRESTHWVRAVEPSREDWLQLDLPSTALLTRVVLRLGRHAGEHLRQWRLETSADGAVWEPVAANTLQAPPFRDLRDDPARLRTELRLPAPTPVRHLRIVRTAAPDTPLDVWPEWVVWGVHDVELFVAP